jgi:Cell wall-associated hydrolases (invasion-associated proteins)
MDRIILRGIVAACMATIPGISSAAQETGKSMAVVSLSANFIREEPDYDKELGDQALMGTLVEITGSESYWRKIVTPEPYTGWVNEMGLVPMTEEEVSDYLAAPKYICTALFSHIYEQADTKSTTITDFILGDIARVAQDSRGNAVARKKFVQVILPDGTKGFVSKSDVALFKEWAEEKLARSSDQDRFRKDLVRTASWFKGVPYMWGGTSIKNVDCSGLVRSILAANGVLVPRNASAQAKIGEDIRIFDKDGNVDVSQLLPGDLIFWGRTATKEKPEKATHTGMYLGNGLFIHSSQVVRVNDFKSYPRIPLRARRVIGHIDEEGSGIVSTRRSPSYFIQR